MSLAPLPPCLGTAARGPLQRGVPALRSPVHVPMSPSHPATPPCVPPGLLSVPQAVPQPCPMRLDTESLSAQPKAPCSAVPTRLARPLLIYLVFTNFCKPLISPTTARTAGGQGFLFGFLDVPSVPGGEWAPSKHGAEDGGWSPVVKDSGGGRRVRRPGPWRGALSVGCTVCGVSCLRGTLSAGHPVCGVSCLWGAGCVCSRFVCRWQCDPRRKVFLIR